MCHLLSNRLFKKERYGILVFLMKNLMELWSFVNAAKLEGLPKIISVQNSYSLLVRYHLED